MFFVLLGVRAAPGMMRSFRINRTTHSQFVTSEIIREQDQCFRLDVVIADPVHGYSNVTADFTFLSDQRLISGKKRTYKFYGVAFPNQSFFALAGMFSVESMIEGEWVMSFLGKQTVSGDKHNRVLESQSQVADFLTKYPASHHAFRIVTLALEVGEGRKGGRRFDLPNVTSGTSFEGKTVQMELRGVEVDGRLYSSELRISTVVYGFLLMLALSAWRSLIHFFRIHRHVFSISSTTLMMEALYEISLGVAMASVCDTDVATSPLVVYFFFVELMVYGAVMFPAILLVFVRRTTIHFTWLTLLVKVVLCMFCVIAPLMRILQSNNFCSLIAALVWVPQIWKNVRMTETDGIDMQFVVLSSVQRVLFRVYMTMYSTNIFEAEHALTDDIISLLIVIQCVILILQTTRSPHFFLPNWLKPKPFDYQETIPEPGEICPVCLTAIDDLNDAAVTPCNHTFHLSCLHRWMEEKYQCPLCRERLPPID